MGEGQGEGGGAQCATHAGVRAADICERCGNFMCAECSSGGAEKRCPACRAHDAGARFTLSRNDWDLGRLWGAAVAAFQREWLMLTAAALMFFLAQLVANMIAGLVQAGADEFKSTPLTMAALALSPLLGIIFSGVVELGVYRITLDVLGGRKADLGRVFSQLPRLGTFLLQRLMVFAIVLAPLLAAAAVGVGAIWGFIGHAPAHPEEALDWVSDGGPGGTPLVVVMLVTVFVMVVVLAYLSLPFSMATAELALDPDVGAWESIQRAYVLARGQRWVILGVGILFALMMVGGLFLCCVGVVPAFALGEVLLVGLFLALRNGSSLPPRDL